MINVKIKDVLLQLQE